MNDREDFGTIIDLKPVAATPKKKVTRPLYAPQPAQSYQPSKPVVKRSLLDRLFNR
jgi:hypothetical protein